MEQENPIKYLSIISAHEDLVNKGYDTWKLL